MFVGEVVPITQRRNRHKLPVIQIISQSTHLYETDRIPRVSSLGAISGEVVFIDVCHMYNKLDNIMLGARGKKTCIPNEKTLP